MAVILHRVPILRDVLLTLGGLPIPELDQLTGLADDRDVIAALDASGDSTDDPIAHVYGGNLVTYSTPARRGLNGVSDLHSVERHDRRQHRGRSWQIVHAGANHPVRGAGRTRFEGPA